VFCRRGYRACEDEAKARPCAGAALRNCGPAEARLRAAGRAAGGGDGTAFRRPPARGRGSRAPVFFAGKRLRDHGPACLPMRRSTGEAFPVPPYGQRLVGVCKGSGFRLRGNPGPSCIGGCGLASLRLPERAEVEADWACGGRLVSGIPEWQASLRDVRGISPPVRRPGSSVVQQAP
jgi:hypothetical protein